MANSDNTVFQGTICPAGDRFVVSPWRLQNLTRKPHDSWERGRECATAWRFRTSALPAARGRARFVRGTTSRFADTARSTAGRAIQTGSWTVPISLAVLRFYKSRSERRGEKRRGRVPRERREIGDTLLHISRRCRLPCRGIWKSPASLRRVCCRSDGRRRVGPTWSRETFSSPASWTAPRCLDEGRLPFRARKDGIACQISRSAI